VLVALAIALGVIVYTLLGPGGGDKKANMQRELDRLIEENKELKEKIRLQKMEVSALRKGGPYLEKVAREELGMLRKDEIIIQLPEDDENKTEQLDKADAELKVP
jgi:cell division protein FtsB